LHSCVKAELIELSFGVVNGVGPGTGDLDGVHMLQGKGQFPGVLVPIGFSWF